MNLRPPRSYSSKPATEPVTKPREGALDYEIAREQAAALGRLGRALERALAALSEFERTQGERAENLPPAPRSPPSAARERLVQDASYAHWHDCGDGTERRGRRRRLARSLFL